MLNQLYILFLLLPVIQSAAERDWSFQSMCEFYDGQYRARDGYNALEGDKCLLTISEATENEEMARLYCEENVPFHINKATPGEKTQCEAEATLICDSNWIQLFGRCYKITKELMSHENAKKHCADQRQNSTIAFIHRHSLPFRIRDYFTSVSRIWIEASEVMTQDLIYDVKGGHLLLALDGYMFDLPNVALARVNASLTAMALCEYTPNMTQAESNYLLGRLGEIYYPTVKTTDGCYVRTASSLRRQVYNTLVENTYCSTMMKPFVPGGHAQSAIPTREFIEEVYRTNENDRGLIVRTSAASKNSMESERRMANCVNRPDAVFQSFITGANGQAVSRPIDQSAWRQGEPKEICDGATWSSAIVLSREGGHGLETMSDARYAPIYCQSVMEKYKYGECPNGYSEFVRIGLGQKWCHKVVATKMTYDDAQKECRKENAFLTGFTSKEEYAFLSELLGPGFNPRYGTDESWLGIRRREECNVRGANGIPGYDRDPNSKCSRNRVFEWVNGVAPNPPKTDNLWTSPFEPNYMGNDEKCLVMMRRKQGGPMQLNDITCASLLRFVCGMEAPIVSE